MVNSEAKISEAAAEKSASPFEISENLKRSFSSEEISMESAVAAAVVSGGENLEIKNHFARLKKRMRCRSSNIL